MPLFLNDQPIKRKDLLGALGLSEEQIPKSASKIFTLSKSLVNIDPDPENRGRKVFPSSHQFKAYYTVRSTDGDSHVFRYARSFDSTRGGITYEPKTVTYKGELWSVEDEDEFLWLFINPRVRQSPLRKVNAQYDFEFFNMQEAAIKRNDDMELRVKSLSLVYGDNALDDEKLRRLLKAFGQEGVDQLTMDSVRATLGEVAGSNPVEFYNKAKSNTMKFEGVIRDAIDKGVLNKVMVNGVVIWKLNGKEIMVISDGSDALKGIKDHITFRMAEYYEEILRGIDGVTRDKVLESDEMDKYFEKLPTELEPGVMKTDLGPKFNRVIASSTRKAEHDAMLEEYSQYDPNDPELHHMKKAKYIKHKDEIEAYIASKKQ